MSSFPTRFFGSCHISTLVTAYSAEECSTAAAVFLCSWLTFTAADISITSQDHLNIVLDHANLLKLSSDHALNVRKFKNLCRVMRSSTVGATEGLWLSEFSLILVADFLHACETDVSPAAYYVFWLACILVIVVTTDRAASVFIKVEINWRLLLWCCCWSSSSH